MILKLLLYAGGALLAILLLVILVGLLLPRKHRVSRTAVFSTSQEQLYMLISGPPDWRPEIKSFEVSERAGREYIREVDRSGEAVTYETVERVPPRRFQRRIADENLPYSGTWTLMVEPASPNARLTITEEGEVKSPLFRFVGRFIIGHSYSINRYFAAVAAKYPRQD